MPPEQIILPINDKQIFFEWFTKLVFYVLLPPLAPKIPLEAENSKETACFFPHFNSSALNVFFPWVINILLSYLSRTLWTSHSPAPYHPTIGCSFILSLSYLHSAPKQKWKHSDKNSPENQMWLAWYPLSAKASRQWEHTLFMNKRQWRFTRNRLVGLRKNQTSNHLWATCQSEKAEEQHIITKLVLLYF